MSPHLCIISDQLVNLVRTCLPTVHTTKPVHQTQQVHRTIPVLRAQSLRWIVGIHRLFAVNLGVWLDGRRRRRPAVETVFALVAGTMDEHKPLTGFQLAMDDCAYELAGKVTNRPQNSLRRKKNMPACLGGTSTMCVVARWRTASMPAIVRR